jgi:CRP-like cAMP-binding protein
MMPFETPFRPLVDKLHRLVALNPEDEAAIVALPHRASRVSSRATLVAEGDRPKECCLLIDGYAARSKLAADGGRQIVSFHVRGDILDLQHLFLEQADHDVQALTDAMIVWIPMEELRALITLRPAIGTAFWRDALIDASIFREWVLNVGRRDARTRVAHMLCEFIVRSEAAGIGTPERILVPFTQDEIGDATGLTPVHVNRMLRALTEEGLITREGRFLQVTDWPKFQQAAGFDRTYLHAA